jgi:hypothetical protein
MATAPIPAYMLSCDSRRELCATTLAALAATDWDEPPIILWDEDPSPDIVARITNNCRRILQRAADEATDLFLYLEDDLDFNRSLRHNVLAWAPVVDRRPGDHLFASLYNPNIVPACSPTDPSPTAIADPRAYYGTQAMLLSVATGRSILADWDDVDSAADIRMSRLAARRSPILFHRPSLVEHRPVSSTWGGTQHRAVDFSPDWRA